MKAHTFALLLALAAPTTSLAEETSPFSPTGQLLLESAAGVGGSVLVGAALGFGAVGLRSIGGGCRREFVGCLPEFLFGGLAGVLIGGPLGVNLAGWLMDLPTLFWRPVLGALIGAAVAALTTSLTSLLSEEVALWVGLVGGMTFPGFGAAAGYVTADEVIQTSDGSPVAFGVRVLPGGAAGVVTIRL